MNLNKDGFVSDSGHLAREGVGDVAALGAGGGLWLTKNERAIAPTANECF